MIGVMNENEPTMMDLMRVLQSNHLRDAENFSMINNQLAKILNEQAGFRAELKSLGEAQDVMKDDQLATQTQVNELNDAVCCLSNQVNQLKQEQLAQNIIISGISVDFVVEEKHISNIAELLGVNLIDGDIKDVRTVKTKKSALTKVVFSSKDVRDSVLLARRGRSLFTDEVKLPGQRHQIFMQEDLTPVNQELLFQARKLKKVGFSGSWSTDGRIKVKHLESKKKYSIESVEQIDYLIRKYEL
jgi:hypothetical protein